MCYLFIIDAIAAKAIAGISGVDGKIITGLNPRITGSLVLNLTAGKGGVAISGEYEAAIFASDLQSACIACCSACSRTE